MEIGGYDVYFLGRNNVPGLCPVQWNPKNLKKTCKPRKPKNLKNFYKKTYVFPALSLLTADAEMQNILIHSKGVFKATELNWTGLRSVQLRQTLSTCRAELDMGRVHELLGRVGLGQLKVTHVQLW